MRAVRRGSRDVRVVVVLERASETVDVDPFRRGDFGFAHGERVAVGVDVPREEIDVLEAVASAERRHLGGTRELKLQLPRIVELDPELFGEFIYRRFPRIAVVVDAHVSGGADVPPVWKRILLRASPLHRQPPSSRVHEPHVRAPVPITVRVH